MNEEYEVVGEPHKRKPFKGVLESRKFWSLVIGLVSLLLVHFGYDELDVDLWVMGIVALLGLYSGSVALEDGLSRLGGLLVALGGKKDPDDR